MGSHSYGHTRTIPSSSEDEKIVMCESEYYFINKFKGEISVFIKYDILLKTNSRADLIRF